IATPAHTTLSLHDALPIFSKKLFVMDVSAGKETRGRIICINPQIVETKGKVVSEEGCLSFPGIYFEVERPEIVTVSAIDLDGKRSEEHTSELQSLTNLVCR